MKLIKGKKWLAAIVLGLLGRRNTARLGRFLFATARRDGGNDMFENGERLVQQYAAGLAERHPDGVVLDVGANVGEWSRLMAAALKEKHTRIFALEACAATYTILEGNIKKWSLDKTVSAISVAASDKAGEAAFYSIGATEGRNSLVEPPEQTALKEIVRTVRLDEWVHQNGIQQILLLKVDTEGHDFAVLAGATQLLRDHIVDLVQFEYNHRWIGAHRFLRDVFEMIQPFGYEIGKVTADGIEFYERWDFELETFVEGNYLVTLPEHRQKLPRVAWWKS